MCKTPSSKLQYPGTVRSILKYDGSCITTAPDEATYSCARFHLNPTNHHQAALWKFPLKPELHTTHKKACVGVHSKRKKPEMITQIQQNSS